MGNGSYGGTQLGMGMKTHRAHGRRMGMGMHGNGNENTQGAWEWEWQNQEWGSLPLRVLIGSIDCQVAITTISSPIVLE
jgi:hypothetical protein